MSSFARHGKSVEGGALFLGTKEKGTGRETLMVSW